MILYIVVRSCATGTVLAEAEVAHGSTQVSFNPINWKQLCVLGDSHVTLYLLEQCGPLTQLTPMYVRNIHSTELGSQLICAGRYLCLLEMVS